MSGENTKLTDEVRVKIKEVASLDGTIEEMAYYCGVSRQTIYNWFEKEPELFDEVERLRQRPVLKARQTIVKALDDPNHAFKYIERKRRKEFGANVDITSDGKQLPTPIYIPDHVRPQEDSAAQ